LPGIALAARATRATGNTDRGSGPSITALNFGRMAHGIRRIWPEIPDIVVNSKAAKSQVR